MFMVIIELIDLGMSSNTKINSVIDFYFRLEKLQEKIVSR